MSDPTINIPRDSTMNTLAKDATLASILAQLTAQQAKLQAITQALIDRDIIGNNSIAGIGDGTLTGAVVSLNNGKQKTLVAGDNIAIDPSTGRIDVTGMDVSYNDLDDVPEDIAFYGDETAGAVEEIDPPLYASDIVNDLVTGGVAVPLSAEQGKILNSNLTDLAWGTAIEITRNIVAGYVYEVPAMGVIAGEFRKTANTNNGSIDIRSDCGITYKFLASVPPINGGYTPIHINVVRGEKITFRQFAEINLSDSHIWFQPYVRRS